MTVSYTGRLLVATPKLADANFARTVVFIVAHGDEGALGVILNRPLETAMHPGWSEYAAPPAVAFSGGPVERMLILGLGRLAGEGPVSNWSPISCGTGLVDLESDPSALRGQLLVVRTYQGYSGWAAGQLEREVNDDAWFVVDAEPDDLFSAQPEQLFHDVLRRQRGTLAMFANYPADPSQN